MSSNQSGNESLKNSNDTPVLPNPSGVIDGIAHDNEMSARERKRLVDLFNWLIEAHALLRKQYKESEELPDEPEIRRLLQLYPMGETNHPARNTSIKTQSEDQQ